MSVSKLTKRLTISSLLGVTALGFTLVPAAASQATPTGSASFATLSISSGSSKPTATIKGSPGTFSPTAITAAPKKFKTTCTAKKADMTFANKSKTSKTITYNGATFGILPGETKASVCQYGPSGYQFVYGISGSTSTLTVTMS